MRSPEDMFEYKARMISAKYQNSIIAANDVDNREKAELEKYLPSWMKVVSISGPIVRCLNTQDETIDVTNKEAIFSGEFKEKL
jgi:hypothetical protein